MKNETAFHGFSAPRTTPGCCTTSAIPSAAIVTNQTSMIHPNIPPTFAVPLYWKEKSVAMMPNAIGTTKRVSVGAMTFSPSTAPNTETAGVMMPSPYRKAPPNNPIVMRNVRRHRSASRCCRCMMSASSANTPPSPLLSARRMNVTYFTLTISTSDQTISDRMP